MGKRGPKPLPDSALKARGSTVPRRREKIREELLPVPGGMPLKPAGMTDAEHAIWKEVVPLLMDMGVLSLADGRSLGRYCRVILEVAAVTKLLRKAPRIIHQAEGGSQYLNPLIKYRADLVRELTALEDRFGLTPSARMTLNVTAMFRPGYKAPEKSEKPEPTTTTKPLGGERFFRGA